MLECVPDLEAITTIQFIEGIPSSQFQFGLSVYRFLNSEELLTHRSNLLSQKKLFTLMLSYYWH